MLSLLPSHSLVHNFGREKFGREHACPKTTAIIFEKIENNPAVGPNVLMRKEQQVTYAYFANILSPGACTMRVAFVEPESWHYTKHVAGPTQKDAALGVAKLRNAPRWRWRSGHSLSATRAKWNWEFATGTRRARCVLLIIVLN